jgi:hypothetical protein
MVFNGGTLILFLWIFSILWLSVLSVFLFRMIGHYNRLTRDISERGLKEILEQVLKRQQTLLGETTQLQHTLDQLSKDGELHIQKLGLVRFNPFSDTGGSQSFTLALLDKNDTGLVMTSLYARTGNRWYVKEVRGGRGKELELSKEEQASIKRAQLVTEKHV